MTVKICKNGFYFEIIDYICDVNLKIIRIIIKNNNATHIHPGWVPVG